MDGATLISDTRVDGSVVALLQAHVCALRTGRRARVAHDALDRLWVAVRAADWTDGQTHLAHDVWRATRHRQLTTVHAAAAPKIVLDLVTAASAAKVAELLVLSLVLVLVLLLLLLLLELLLLLLLLLLLELLELLVLVLWAG